MSSPATSFRLMMIKFKTCLEIGPLTPRERSRELESGGKDVDPSTKANSVVGVFCKVNLGLFANVPGKLDTTTSN